MSWWTPLLAFLLIGFTADRLQSRGWRGSSILVGALGGVLIAYLIIQCVKASITP